MTPAELLDQVKQEFPVLVHGTGPEGQQALDGLLRSAIREYQERRGFRAELVIPDAVVNCEGVLLPETWVTALNSHDSQRVHVIIDIFDHYPEPVDGATEPPLPEKRIRCLPNDYHTPPYTLMYLQDLTSAELGSVEPVADGEDPPLPGVKLPLESIGIIKRYLYALIDIPNTKRLRAMYEGIDHPARDQLSDISALEQNAADIREEMSMEAGDLLSVLAL